MNIDYYLNYIDKLTILSDEEVKSINTSINTIKSRLSSGLGNEIKDQGFFGSFSRSTILPRKMDKDSDIDYMIVFEDSTLNPQSYLDKLRNFVDYSYVRSEIKQSHPTIQLSLNHIRFELIPAIWKDNILKIPAKASLVQNWINTDPQSFKKKLEALDSQRDGLIRPLIRLVKYWNVLNGKIFPSFNLERRILNFNSNLNNYSPSLGSYFLELMSSIKNDPEYSIDKQNKIKKMLYIVRDIKSGSHNSLNEKLFKLLPHP